MVDQGSGIVRAMLGLSRSAKADARSVDLNKLMSETARIVSDQLPDGVELRLDLGADLSPAEVAPDLLRQILLNLILNASDATSGRGRIWLRSGVVKQLPADLVLAPAVAESYLTAVVQDTGHGIAPEVLSRMFEPFYTTKALSTRRGTGLGLTMVYEIAKETGLGLTAESVEGEGAVFVVLIPAAGLA
jgi:signal transduction histidine kinase